MRLPAGHPKLRKDFAARPGRHSERRGGRFPQMNLFLLIAGSIAAERQPTRQPRVPVRHVFVAGGVVVQSQRLRLMQVREQDDLASPRVNVGSQRDQRATVLRPGRRVMIVPITMQSKDRDRLHVRLTHRLLNLAQRRQSSCADQFAPQRDGQLAGQQFGVLSLRERNDE